MNNKKEKQPDSSRRRFIKTAGKIAVYTPPAMLAVSSPSFAQIARSGGTSDGCDLQSDVKCEILTIQR